MLDFCEACHSFEIFQNENAPKTPRARSLTQRRTGLEIFGGGQT